jgi:hypothetical protein
MSCTMHESIVGRAEASRSSRRRPGGDESRWRGCS